MVWYLDIDGVLNSGPQQYGKMGYQQFLKLSSEIDEKYRNKIVEHLDNLDSRYLRALEGFMELHNTATEIVICSTWRKIFSCSELKYMFALKGAFEIARKISRCIEVEPKDLYPGLNRAEAEIVEDARLNGVEKYFILSDDVSRLTGNYFEEFADYRTQYHFNNRK